MNESEFSKEHNKIKIVLVFPCENSLIKRERKKALKEAMRVLDYAKHHSENWFERCLATCSDPEVIDKAGEETKLICNFLKTARIFDPRQDG